MTLVTQDSLVWLTPEEDEGAIAVDGSGEGDGAVTDGEGNAEAEPFLKLNDRQVYKTKDDVIRSMNEAGKTITSLSELRKVIAEHGGPKDADGVYLKGLITEFIKLKTEAQKASAAAASKKGTPSDEDKEFEGQDPELVARTKRGRQWLKDNAEKVGLISQEKYSKLEKDFNDFKQSFTQKDQAAEDAAIEEGQQKVTDWLGEAKVELSAETREELEDAIVAFINSKPATQAAWQTGDKATRLGLIRKGFELFLPIVKPGASVTAKASASVGAGKTKAGLVKRTPGKLPQAGDGTPPKDKDGKFVKIGSQSLRDKAKQLMEKLEAEQAGGGD